MKMEANGSKDINVMVNLKPGEYMGKMFYSVNDTGDSENKIQVLPTGVEPMTFWLLFQMLYH